MTTTATATTTAAEIGIEIQIEVKTNIAIVRTGIVIQLRSGDVTVTVTASVAMRIIMTEDIAIDIDHHLMNDLPLSSGDQSLVHIHLVILATLTTMVLSVIVMR